MKNNFPLKRHAIVVRALAFVIIVCVLLVALDIWRSWNARVVELNEMSTATANISRAAAQQADDTLKEADTAILGIVERVEFDGNDPAALARLHTLMVRRVAELPQLNGLFVYDETGKWIETSQPTLLREFNNSDREYFDFHRTHADRGPHIGLPVISKSTGKWIIPVSRRVDKADGSFGGVVLATVNIEFFKAFYETFQLGQDGVIALLSNDGILMLRRPYNENSIGKSVVNSPIFRLYKREKVGTAFINSSQDGVLRLNSRRPLQHYPLFVVAALSKEEILADWWHDTLWHAGAVSVFVVLVGVFGWRLVQQIDLRIKAEAELIRARDALEKLNQTLEKLALQDGLTGLANRRQFDLLLDDEFRLATRQASTLALIMVDVDCFKQYNDIYGHAAGDECLRTISRMIRELTAQRPGDVAARYGGEEIAVLLPNTDVSRAVAVAEKIRDSICNLGIEHAGNPSGFVTVSAGVDARVPAPGSDEPTVLIKAADKALYLAKSTGRNRVCLNDADPAV